MYNNGNIKKRFIKYGNIETQKQKRETQKFINKLKCKNIVTLK